MWTKIKDFLRRKADIAERGVWTALQTLTAAGVVTWLELDAGWIVPVAAALAFVKGAIAERFGNGSAATLPGSLEPVPAHVIEDWTGGNPE